MDGYQLAALMDQTGRLFGSNGMWTFFCIVPACVLRVAPVQIKMLLYIIYILYAMQFVMDILLQLAPTLLLQFTLCASLNVG